MPVWAMWVELVAVAVVCLPLGGFFGAMPLKNSQMSQQQQKVSSAVSLLAIGLFIAMMILHQDAASWVVIAALALGFALAKIPVLHAWLLSHFAFFVPAGPDRSAPARQAKAGTAGRPSTGGGRPGKSAPGRSRSGAAQGAAKRSVGRSGRQPSGRTGAGKSSKQAAKKR